MTYITKIIADFFSLNGTLLVHAFVITFVTMFIFLFLRSRLVVHLIKWSKHTENKLDDAVAAMVDSIKTPFYLAVSVYLGIQVFALSSSAKMIINSILLVVISFYGIRAIITALKIYFEQTTAQKTELAARRFFITLVKIILWTVAILLLLSNLNINITSLVAGLGIGGIAIAFALQNILTDLFSSFAIYFDKPFVVGDFIIVGQHMGIVERIGIKTTRIRALQGEEIVISNRELTTARVQNFHSMNGRRVVTTIGIEYGTPKEVVAALPVKIKERIATVKGVKVDRVHFSGFGDSALTFDLVYYVLSGDYMEYMDRQQEINLSIMDLFEQEKVSFAFPSQTVYLQSSSTKK